MGLPHNTITPIPNNEPDAVPSLWNVRYQEIDENFDNLDNRTEAVESEIHAARAGKPNLSETINAITFLELSDAWQYWFPGAVILIAAAIYARVSTDEQTTQNQIRQLREVAERAGW